MLFSLKPLHNPVEWKTSQISQRKLVKLLSRLRLCSLISYRPPNWLLELAMLLRGTFFSNTIKSFANKLKNIKGESSRISGMVSCFHLSHHPQPSGVHVICKKNYPRKSLQSKSE